MRRALHSLGFELNKSCSSATTGTSWKIIHRYDNCRFQRYLPSLLASAKYARIICPDTETRFAFFSRPGHVQATQLNLVAEGGGAYRVSRNVSVDPVLVVVYLHMNEIRFLSNTRESHINEICFQVCAKYIIEHHFRHSHNTARETHDCLGIESCNRISRHRLW